MRRSQLKLNETSSESLLDSPNQSLNNSLNQSDFNHTILRINESDVYQMENLKSKVLKLSHNYSNGLDHLKIMNEGESDNQTDAKRSLEILLHDPNSLSGSNEFYKKNPVGLAKDFNTIVFLLFLYFLQGIPLGLTGALPFILQSQKVTYSDQFEYLNILFLCLGRILWAPIVDSLYWKKFGRRKSWLVPMQYLIGIFLITFSNYVHDLLESEVSNPHESIVILTMIFFVITFFTATQDVAVDGWALEILTKENISWASTCNTAGQSAGWFVGNVIFLGIIFLITTTVICLCKKEKSFEQEAQRSFEDRLTVKETYNIVFHLFKLSSVRKLVLVLLTCKIAFGLSSVAYLKLIEKGVPKEKLGLLALPLTPFEVVFPLLISRYTNGPYPLSVFTKAYPFRILASFIIVLWVYISPLFKDSVTNEYPFYFFVMCLFINVFHSAFQTIMSVATMSFFTKISDKNIGGTYMTMLTTVSNIGMLLEEFYYIHAYSIAYNILIKGSGWPQTLCLYLVDWLSINTCSYDPITKPTLEENDINFLEQIENNSCDSPAKIKQCGEFGGKCIVYMDAYYMIAIGCAIFGLMWIWSYRSYLYSLQTLQKNAWMINLKAPKKESNESIN